MSSLEELDGAAREDLEYRKRGDSSRGPRIKYRDLERLLHELVFEEEINREVAG